MIRQKQITQMVWETGDGRQFPSKKDAQKHELRSLLEKLCDQEDLDADALSVSDVIGLLLLSPSLFTNLLSCFEASREP